MINKTKIENLVEEYIAERDIFLVSVNVSTGNKVTVLVNRPTGISIEDCVKLSRHIEGSLDRDAEDFELSVSSPGLGEPLLVPRQYEMNIGKKVQVTDSEGKKHVGELVSFNEDSILIQSKVKEKGKKRNLVDVPFNLEEIRSVKVLVTFKKIKTL